ncbi:nuclear transport factor 2 family protein [Sphingobium indicum]|uniref:Nuclear transport factor 2 family protein n=2 Tax=Sphingobium indicum TaxID=332055 RepID=A0A4Q4J6C2_9SPHN|nr:nuclear transport factor 2 family protein [Sphingobium indicum]
MKSAMLTVAERFTQAFSNRDAAGFVSTYGPDATVWHNDDRIVQAREENLAKLQGFFSICSAVEYRNIERDVTDAGTLVQQHVVWGRLNDGREFEVPVCMIIKFKDGLIHHIAEYCDPAPFHQLLHGAD